jgi:hypothetical protein
MEIVAKDIPAVISQFFHASVSYDKELLSCCFAEDAVVYDEGREFHGRKEIKDHIVGTNRDLQVQKKIERVVSKNNEITVTAVLSGKFEGSPCALDYHFVLDGHLITRLKIIFAGEAE